MQKLILRVGHFVFLSVFGVFILFFLYWEIITLASYGSKSNIVVWGAVLGDESQVLISTAENDLNNSIELNNEILKGDARPVIIKKYLEKYKSPLVPYSNLIFELSNTYGFEYYWIVAIAQQESNLCKKIPEDSHNCWGYGIHKNGTLKFENYDLALKSYAEYLKREYFDKGLNTPELIMKKYCPSSNGSWANGVRQFIDEMENGNF